MDAVSNPYVPGAGSPPPALVGRDPLIETNRVALARILAGKPTKSLMPTGLRGVGKTVLLNRFAEEAEKLGFRTSFMEASENGTLPRLLGAHLRKVLYDLDRLGHVSDLVKRAFRVFRGFNISTGIDGSVKLAVDVRPEVGVADSGDLTADLTELFVAIGEAARERHVGIFLAIDEVQYLDDEELAALIMAIHRTTQLQLPVMLVGAGLPQLLALAGNAKSYSERLFDFPRIGALSREDARRAILEPAQKQNVTFSDEALDQLVRTTEGYPYFLQEWGFHVWNHATSATVTLDDVRAVEPIVLDRLDESFFRVRLDRLTPREKQYLRAMAQLGAGPHRSGDIADLLNIKVESAAPLRSGLIRKGMIYSPAHGDTGFTVPLFDAFMRRAMP